jgi:hypothetical protein
MLAFTVRIDANLAALIREVAAMRIADVSTP